MPRVQPTGALHPEIAGKDQMAVCSRSFDAATTHPWALRYLLDHPRPVDAVAAQFYRAQRVAGAWAFTNARGALLVENSGNGRTGELTLTFHV